MKTHFLYLSLLLSLTAISAKAQKSIEFITTKQNIEKKAIRTLLIAGIGKTPARIFLDNLCDELHKDLKARNVQAEYQYLGSDVKAANDELNRYASEQKHDAILIINQTDTAVATRINRSGYVAIPTGGSVPSIPLAYSPLFAGKSKVIFDQQFEFRLFEKNASSSLWDASLNVYSDLSKKSVYANISEKIIRSFQDNRIFW